MCENCYKTYGSPKVFNENVLAARQLVDLVYMYNGAGGSCHIVLDDWNLKDSDIDFCLEYIEKETTPETIEQNQIEKACMELFKKLTMNERATALMHSEEEIFDGMGKVLIKVNDIVDVNITRESVPEEKGENND